MTRRDQDERSRRVVGRIDAIAPGSPAPDTVPSGFPSLDRMLGGGFRRQDLVVLGGDVGSGKSALALGDGGPGRAGRHADALPLGGDEPERVLERALALEGRAPIDDLRQGRLDAHARAAVGAAAVRLRGMPLLLRPLLGASFDEVSAALDQVPRPGARGGGRAAAGAFAPARGPAGRAHRPGRPRAQGAGDGAQRGRARPGAAAGASSGPRRPAPHARRPRRAREHQADGGSGAGDLPGGDVPAGPGRGRRDGAHHRQEPQRADRVRGSVLLPAMAPVRGPAGSGRARQAGRQDAGLAPALSILLSTAPDNSTVEPPPFARLECAPRAADRSAGRGARWRPPHPSPRSPASSCRS